MTTPQGSSCWTPPVAERANFNPKKIDPQHWAFVKRRKEVSVFNSVPGSTNPSIIVMVGSDLIDGRLEDVMGGLYCETTDELRTAKVLLGYDLKGSTCTNGADQRIRSGLQVSSGSLVGVCGDCYTTETH
ncbi:hypothetical protein PI124_g15309 [Phytophthora idaei]|nr:hypothetical protein PI126_g13393 [Phytophthora idaei]KAG3239765.1 hypothetical protein PI124_g15309 [Phytophthora idaei]